MKAKVDDIQLTNPAKYEGDLTKLNARSGWEVLFMQILDKHPNVVSWTSEPKNLNITYYNPLTKKIQQYYTDFIIRYGSGQVEMVEIKPIAQCVQSMSKSKYDAECVIVNHAKWTSAIRFCDSNKMVFRVVTENELGIKKR